MSFLNQARKLIPQVRSQIEFYKFSPELLLDVSIPPLSTALASAILSRSTTVDLTHILCNPSTSISEVVHTLQQVFAALDSYQDGLSSMLTGDILGLALEVYR